MDLREETNGLDLVCRADPHALEQLFRNILENAIAACQEPGEVVVSCEETEGGGQAALQISIRDNGPGFLPDAREKIFEPFFTTKAKGTGLGMAIAKRIVEAHGGEIVIGEHASGAEITLTLPR